MTVDEMIESLQLLSDEGYGNTNVEMTIVDSNGEQFNVSELSFCVYDQKNLIVIEEKEPRLIDVTYED